jgi:hypothetical protein
VCSKWPLLSPHKPITRPTDFILTAPLPVLSLSTINHAVPHWAICPSLSSHFLPLTSRQNTSLNTVSAYTFSDSMRHKSSATTMSGAQISHHNTQTTSRLQNSHSKTKRNKWEYFLSWANVGRWNDQWTSEVADSSTATTPQRNYPRQTETARCFLPSVRGKHTVKEGRQVKDEILIAHQMHPLLTLTDHPRDPTTTSLTTTSISSNIHVCHLHNDYEGQNGKRVTFTNYPNLAFRLRMNIFVQYCCIHIPWYLNFLTLHTAVRSTVRQLLGWRRKGQAMSYSFQKHLLRS